MFIDCFLRSRRFAAIRDKRHVVASTRLSLVSGHYGGVAKQKVSTDYSQPRGIILVRYGHPNQNYLCFLPFISFVATGYERTHTNISGAANSDYSIVILGYRKRNAGYSDLLSKPYGSGWSLFSLCFSDINQKAYMQLRPSLAALAYMGQLMPQNLEQ